MTTEPETPIPNPHRFEKTFGDFKVCSICDKKRGADIHKDASATQQSKE